MCHKIECVSIRSSYSSQNSMSENRKRQKNTGVFFCLRPNLRDSLPPRERGLRLPLWCTAAGPYFPKRRPDPIFLPESFCIPLRRRKTRSLSEPSSDHHSFFSGPFFRARGQKIICLCLVFVHFEYSIRPRRSQALSPLRRGRRPRRPASAPS